MRSYYDFLLFAEEQAQWCDAHQLEAVLEEVFDEIALDLSEFGGPDIVTPYGREFGAVDLGQGTR